MEITNRNVKSVLIQDTAEWINTNNFQVVQENIDSRPKVAQKYALPDGLSVKKLDDDLRIFDDQIGEFVDLTRHSSGNPQCIDRFGVRGHVFAKN
jgi:hypothetical protein